MPPVRVLPVAFALGLLLSPAARAADPVRWERRVLTAEYYCDGVAAGDIDRDGHADIVAGPFWFAGPDFKTRHEFYPAKPFDRAASPTDSLFSYVHDLNGDGWPDVLVLGRVHLHAAYWYENPGKGVAAAGHWKKHFVFDRVRGESPPFADADGDGRPELVAHWENRWGFIRPDWKQLAKPWAFTPITAAGEYNQFYHGTGIGDVNGDGRPDLLLNDGWWEQPAEPGKEWTAHPFKFAPRGGAQMFAYDVNGDGRNDVITSLDAHGWGLAWFEQVRDGDRITFTKHPVMGDRSELAKYGVAFTQPHALALADLDGDGLKDVIVGKRRWAHGPKGDIEPEASPVVYWFRLERGKDGVRFVPHLIDDASGVGTQIAAADVNGDGRPDVLTASKLGVFVFLNREPGDKQPR